MEKEIKIEAPEGKLGVLLPGLGAVATTFIAGVELVKKKKAQPIGSLTQMGTIRLGKRTDQRSPLIREFVPLESIDNLVFGAWDCFPDDAFESAVKSGVLSFHHREEVKEELSSIVPMKAVFDREWVARLDGNHVKKGKTKIELGEQLIEDIRAFREKTGVKRCVMIWCASTEKYQKAEAVHASLDAFEKAMKENHPAVAPSQIYAWASLKSDVPFANGAPNLTVDIPAIAELAKKKNLPIAGKDFKTGQTLMKTIIAPGLKARLIGIAGWFSTNILGNRDGEVLDDPAAFKTKEESKLSVLDTILQPHLYPLLYEKLYHKVRINYYPPRGDNKEGWDNLDIFGWLGYPMQIKIDFLCRDSILAAPLVLDLALFMDLAKRAGMSGIQEWLSFYFKSPMSAPGLTAEHDLFIQLKKLKNTLRHLRGEDLITHLGLEYYD
ncbi:MAG: inositol-3-phosphate synthase [Pseudomonadota bacterium]